MHPNLATLGNSGSVHRGGLSLLLVLSILALSTSLSGCKKPADALSPVAPAAGGFTLRGFVSEIAADGGSGIGAVLVAITSGAHSGASTTTDSVGSYSIPELTGELNVRFSRDGFVATGRTVNMNEETVLNLTLMREDGPDPSDPTFTLSGVVSEGQGDGDAIGAAVIEVVDGPHEGDASTTDSLGRYSIPALSGELTVRASHDSFAAREETVDMTEDRTLSFSLLFPPDVSMCLDLDDEEVHITNNSTEHELVLTDWVLREADEGNAFTFVEDIDCRESMSGFTLPPRATVIITSGDDPLHNPPTHIAGWCKFVWDNDGDIARLVNVDGDRVTRAVGTRRSCDVG